MFLLWCSEWRWSSYGYDGHHQATWWPSRQLPGYRGWSQFQGSHGWLPHLQQRCRCQLYLHFHPLPICSFLSRLFTIFFSVFFLFPSKGLSDVRLFRGYFTSRIFLIIVGVYARNNVSDLTINYGWYYRWTPSLWTFLEELFAVMRLLKASLPLLRRATSKYQ